MGSKSLWICPHLKGSSQGVMCSVQNRLVSIIEDADVKLCTSRHFEVCSIYLTELKHCYEVSLSGAMLEAYHKLV